MMTNLKLYAGLGLGVVIIGMAITIGIYSLKTKTLKADNVGRIRPILGGG